MMSDLLLVEMSPERYLQFMEGSFSQYVRDRMAADFEDYTQARTKAEQQRQTLLPHGQQTAEHYFYDLQSGGEVVGGAWLNVSIAGAAYLYYIEILPQHRRKGLGRLALAELEARAKEGGAKVFWLNVMGSNTAAQSLYRSRGFEVAAMHMNKRL